MDEDFEKLERLSLVNSITKELHNHVGLQDSTLAEYLISLHEESASFENFKAKLQEIGAEFPESFVTNMDRLVTSLHPKYKKKKLAAEGKGKEKEADPAGDEEELERKKRRAQALFPALALPDRSWEPSFVPDTNDPTGKNAASADNLLEELENVARRHRELQAVREEDEVEENDSDYNRPSKAPRRDRSASRERGRRSPEPRSGRLRDDHSGGRFNDRGRQRDNGYNNRAAKALDTRPVLYKIYDGTVASIKDFGCFVTLKGVSGKAEGLVHVNAIAAGRVNHPSDLVSRGQPVKVKVVSIAGERIGISMKDVDQNTGADLTPHLRIKTDAEMAEEEAQYAARHVNHSTGAGFADDNRSSSARRLTSPERWEIKQLIASGAASAADYPNLDDDLTTPGSTNGMAAAATAEEELDIEMREDEAPFLKGAHRRVLDLSPVKIVKAPDGTLNRAALAGAGLAKERRELRQQEANERADAETQDTSTAWLDPVAKPHERLFAQDARDNTMGKKQEESGWKQATFNQATTYGKITSLSITEQRASLPIYKLRDALVKAVKENQILVVVGDTGSGKTTQMTQYLAEEGLADEKKIACTQPRRVAAMSVAKRVAEEVGCRLGQDVGYTIRFEDCTSPETKIKYMTDGMLQREALVDPNLSAYSVIMLDEAHERTIATDVLFGLLKKSIMRRPDLKLIVTSATLDAEKFSKYFYSCPIFTIPGRTYPVEILYTKEPESDYLDAALITIMQIHISEPPGDILLFLTGQEEIDTSAEILYERMKALGSHVPELIVLPVYSALPSEMQSKIFDPAPPGARKVILATNIAETSITIDGIYYVVDPGFVKQKAWDPRLGMDSLVVTPISQAQARQRSGRAGRTGPGKCYRLYTEAAYRNEMLPTSIPDIQRQNLAHTILMLKAMGINDLLNFDFMDPPPQQTMITALENLYALSALDDEGLLTRLGRKMADFPMDPELSKMLIASVDLGCSEEVLTIVAMISGATNVFYRPKDKQAQADAKKAKFHQPEGDHLTLLAVYEGWKNSKFSNPWCHENYIQSRAMRRAQDVRKQLLGIMDRYKHDIVSCGTNYDRVRRAICSGYFRHAAKKDPQEGYKTLVEGTPVFIHPSSALFNRAPEWIIYHELVLTTKEYCRDVTAIEPKWLTEVAPTFFKVADAKTMSKRKRNERVQPLFDRFAKSENDWRISKVKRSTRTSQTFG
ncbi:DEAH-box ATP-dependent RNA helicase prp22 [Puccinia graminis f. sp. tritici]|uniref:RNA helicase n=2 Tax=Puccinia graminis f. sp. tritici TaxID=56615 RepID=E3KI43_PUCGT|nr:adenosinetriphosphatase [Puccinia graminis f. sp. tritici CRL 75-36-700-3]EFP83968.1 adenosinetriphosphatase [Puccinia graminis f. sp. tritici CRL 75-36-700-3]KAA1064671.1 DEAH-box ATP-dependent RNA helicase prp22 [Puccinia graminis f. sp. tritici]